MTNNDPFAARLQTATAYLQKVDSYLGSVITEIGPCTLHPHTNYYQALVESIIGQQLSVKAAAAIRKRFLDLFDGDFPSPKSILQTSTEGLRAVGFSGAKANYVRDLAGHVENGQIKFDHLDSLGNEEIIKELVAVKGIGEWTAHMFLIFCMSRLDVLAHGDLGIRVGIKQLYKLPKLPTPKEVQTLARVKGWPPYNSVACWYIWRSLEISLE